MEGEIGEIFNYAPSLTISNGIAQAYNVSQKNRRHDNIKIHFIFTCFITEHYLRYK